MTSPIFILEDNFRKAVKKAGVGIVNFGLAPDYSFNKRIRVHKENYSLFMKLIEGEDIYVVPSSSVKPNRYDICFTNRTEYEKFLERVIDSYGVLA